MAQLVKNLSAVREIWVWFLVWEDPLQKGKASHWSGKYPLQYSRLENSLDNSPWGCKESDMTERLSLCFTSWRVVLGVKNPSANAGYVRNVGSVPGLGRSSGEGNGNPVQYSCLENPMDRGAWWAIVHWVAKSQTGLKWLSTHDNYSKDIREALSMEEKG